jgi:hypothetical protein
VQDVPQSRPSKKSKKRRSRPPTRYPLRTALLALLGGACLGVGLAAPVVRVDFYGPVRLWDIAGEEACFLLVAALVCVHSAAPRRQRRLVPGALLLWAGLTFPLWERELLPDRRGWLARLGDRVADGLASTASDILFSADLVHYEWGLWTLLAGCALVTVSGLLALRGPARKGR